MASRGGRGCHEEGPIFGRSDGQDPAGGRHEHRDRGRQEARGQRADDLPVAQALWPAGGGGREAAAADREREREAEETVGRARSGDRFDEGDCAKKMVSAPARRRQVEYLQHGGVSIRRACVLLSVARSSLRYRSRLVERDAPVLAAMRELSAQYPRYGYRRIQVVLGRRGQLMSAASPPDLAASLAFRCLVKGHAGV